MCILLVLVLSTLICGPLVDGSNILFIHLFASYSHRVSMMPLANALIEKGHNVTYIAPMHAQVPNPKMIDIVPSSFKDFIDSNLNAQFNLNLRITNDQPNLCKISDELVIKSCEVLLNAYEFKRWMEQSPKIDLIISDFTPVCTMGIAHKLNSKVIIYNTVPFSGKYVDLLHLPEESLVTNAEQPYATTMNFWERIKNTLVPLVWNFYEYKHTDYLETVLKTGLGIKHLPNAHDLLQNISLVFLTGNYISEQPRSLPPMIVQIPGLHVKDTSEIGPLPKEMENFLNSDENDGFVYISLGTVVVAPQLPKRVLNVFMNAIKAFPKIKFFWRWGGKFPKNIPTNLYISDWFPQQDVLGHPKIRGFITQCGRPSLQEALVYAVPLIAFPVLGDQDFNAMRIEDIGVGIKLEITKVTQTQLESSLTQILHNNSFRANAKRMSTLFTDLPMRPIDTAVWWTEYVLRHDDLSHLKPLARHQTWYQRRLLDVWFALFIAAAFIILGLGFVIFHAFKIVPSLHWIEKVKTL